MQIVDNIITQYIVIFINVLCLISKTKPATNPLHANKSLGHWPISIVPEVCSNVTALSNVLKIQVISAISKISKIPVIVSFDLRTANFSLPTTPLPAGVSINRAACGSTVCSVCSKNAARPSKKSVRMIISTKSEWIRLLFANCSKILKA